MISFFHHATFMDCVIFGSSSFLGRGAIVVVVITANVVVVIRTTVIVVEVVIIIEVLIYYTIEAYLYVL